MQVSLVAGTVLFAVSKGIPMERITAETGLTGLDLVDPNGRLPDHLLAGVWRLIAEAHPGEALSLELAAAAPPSFFGAVSIAMAHASDLEEAITLFARFQRIISDRLKVDVIELEDELHLRIFHPTDALDDGYAAEVGIAMGARYPKEVLGVADTLIRVEFVHGPHGPLEIYEDFFGVPVLFHQARNAVVFRSTHASLPVPRSDPHLLQAIQAHLETVHQGLVQEDDPQELVRIREALAENAQRADYSGQSLAKRLGMSLRSLQRLAKRCGSSVRALIDEAREAHARRLLGDPRLSVEEVSFLLGYSEDRAFRRAFKRWTGLTPAAFRSA